MLKFFPMRNLTVLLLTIALLSSGCSFFKGTQTAQIQDISFVHEGKIVQKDRLKEGGQLLIVPFSAGVNVAATEDLERISLQIVKGISEVLHDQNAPYEVMMADEANLANLQMSGHVIEMSMPGKFKKWLPGREKQSLSVAGQLMDVDNQRVILQFSHTEESREKGETFDDLGLKIGQDIGQFMVSGLE